ncbi:response regulator transcription factor [Luteococcus sp. Sow4_B9]|uniref:response regulator transcription factor n=1 Tax=Luteococcus sp. Sow4_B9 TaxID=3438792 RepID=UPI003F9E94A3
MIRVGVCDNDPMVRELLAAYLRTDPTVELSGSYGSGHEVVERASKDELDVLILDVRMPTMSGPEVAERLATLHEGVRILLLTSYPSDLHKTWRPTPNVMGTLTKDLAPESLLAAIRLANSSISTTSPAFRNSANISTSGSQPKHPDLTSREQEILDLLCRGASNQEIAATLFLSESTVKKALVRLCRHFGVANRTALALRYLNP